MVKGIEIHISDECICGQVHDTVYHLSEGETNVHLQYPKFEPIREVTKEFAPHVEVKPEKEIDLSGKCKEVKIEGIEWRKDRGFVCKGCGIPVVQGLIADIPKDQEQKYMYFIDNGDCHGAQALERLERPKEQSPNMLHIQINRLDGSCPVQASGTIEDHSAFYFRGRHEQWQFVAGPKELNTNDLVKVQLKMTQDSRVFVLEGDDEERNYEDYDHVRRCLQTYAQQYVEWMKERKREGK